MSPRPYFLLITSLACLTCIWAVTVILLLVAWNRARREIEAMKRKPYYDFMWHYLMEHYLRKLFRDDRSP